MKSSQSNSKIFDNSKADAQVTLEESLKVTE